MPEESLSDVVAAKLVAESESLARLEGVPLKAVEKKRIRFLKRLAARQAPLPNALPEIDQLLVREFLKLGAKAVLSTGAQRYARPGGSPEDHHNLSRDRTCGRQEAGSDPV